MRQYYVKDISQTTMVIGGLLFPVVLSIPMYSNYDDTQASVMWALMGVALAYILVTQITCTIQAAAEQTRRKNMLKEFIDIRGQLLPHIYPSDAKMKPEDWRFMYTV